MLIPYAETRQEAERVKGHHWCGKRGLGLIDQDWDLTFYNYPKSSGNMGSPIYHFVARSASLEGSAEGCLSPMLDSQPSHRAA